VIDAGALGELFEHRKRPVVEMRFGEIEIEPGFFERELRQAIRIGQKARVLRRESGKG
jgi:hypothetical protein